MNRLTTLAVFIVAATILFASDKISARQLVKRNNQYGDEVAPPKVEASASTPAAAPEAQAAAGAGASPAPAAPAESAGTPAPAASPPAPSEQPSASVAQPAPDTSKAKSAPSGYRKKRNNQYEEDSHSGPFFEGGPGQFWVPAQQGFWVPSQQGFLVSPSSGHSSSSHGGGNTFWGNSGHSESSGHSGASHSEGQSSSGGSSGGQSFSLPSLFNFNHGALSFSIGYGDEANAPKKGGNGGSAPSPAAEKAPSQIEQVGTGEAPKQKPSGY